VGVGGRLRKIKELAILCFFSSGLNLAFCLTSTSSQSGRRAIPFFLQQLLV